MNTYSIENIWTNLVCIFDNELISSGKGKTWEKNFSGSDIYVGDDENTNLTRATIGQVDQCTFKLILIEIGLPKGNSGLWDNDCKTFKKHTSDQFQILQPSVLNSKSQNKITYTLIPHMKIFSILDLAPASSPSLSLWGPIKLKMKSAPES